MGGSISLISLRSSMVSLQCLGSAGEGTSPTASEDTASDRATGSHTPSDIHAPARDGLDKTNSPVHRTVHRTQSRASLVMEKMRRNIGGHSGGPLALLGVESSCDDTGVGVVDERGCVLGEAIHSQMLDHQK